MALALGQHKPTFYIDTRNRISGTPSNFFYQVNIEPSESYDQVALIQFIAPKSFYNISIHNNSFELSFVFSPTGVNNVILPPGNYTVYSLIPALQKALNSAANTLGYNYSFLINFNELTYKYEYAVYNNIWTDPIFVSPTFTFNNRISTALGFERDSSNPFSLGKLTSKYLISLQYTKYINIKSSICSNLTNLDGDNTDTLQRIPILDTPDSSKIIYESISLEESTRSLVSSKASIFHFVFVDDHGDELDMNNGESKFVIMIYRHNPFYEMSINQLQIDIIKEKLSKKGKEQEDLAVEQEQIQEEQ